MEEGRLEDKGGMVDSKSVQRSKRRGRFRSSRGNMGKLKGKRRDNEDNRRNIKQIKTLKSLGLKRNNKENGRKKKWK